MTDDELTERVVFVRAEWGDLLDDLVASGGELPTRMTVERLAEFFESTFWIAERALAEVARRDVSESIGRWPSCAAGER